MDLLQFFTYEHLPAHLQEISKPFCVLAKQVYDREEALCSASQAETRACLRKLLEAKDCAVRAAVAK